MSKLVSKAFVETHNQFLEQWGKEAHKLDAVFSDLLDKNYAAEIKNIAVEHVPPFSVGDRIVTAHSKRLGTVLSVEPAICLNDPEDYYAPTSGPGAYKTLAHHTDDDSHPHDLEYSYWHASVQLDPTVNQKSRGRKGAVIDEMTENLKLVKLAEEKK